MADDDVRHPLIFFMVVHDCIAIFLEPCQTTQVPLCTRLLNLNIQVKNVDPIVIYRARREAKRASKACVEEQKATVRKKVGAMRVELFKSSPGGGILSRDSIIVWCTSQSGI